MMKTSKYLKWIIYFIFSNLGLYWLESKKLIGYVQLFAGTLSLILMINSINYVPQYILTSIIFTNIVLWIIGIIELLYKIDILLINE
jgi:hypothetical protein